MISISTITLKSAEPHATARFWRELLGYTVAPNHSDSVLLTGDGPALPIQPADATPEPGLIHLDLRPDNQQDEVARALALGARIADIGQTGDEGWVVLQDPAGNLFCILEAADDEARRETSPATPTDID